MSISAPRRLSGALEPFAGQVYFAPECHENYQSLGFGPSPGDFAGVAAPESESYFCSRGSVMGQVPGTVVAAAFGVFEHRAVAQFVEAGWTKTDAATICAARDDGAVRHLRRILGDRPDGAERVRTALARAVEVCEPYGKPLFSGLLAQPRFDDPLADCWRLADLLREFRGDAHTAVWTSADLDACQIGLLSELYWGLPARSYSRTRMWSDDDYTRAEPPLVEQGLIADGALTTEGLAFREQIEAATDRLCLPITDALGADLEVVIRHLEAWSASVKAANGYPPAGPQDLARAARGAQP